MNARDLNAAIQYIDDRYLDMVDAPPKETMKLLKRKMTVRAALIAAIIAMLVLTAFAADLMNVKSWYSGTRRSFTAFSALEGAMEEAGFKMAALERSNTGYVCEKVKVEDVCGMDENDQTVVTLSEISIMYRNECGNILFLSGTPDSLYTKQEPGLAAELRYIDGIEVFCYVDYYRMVPEDYEQTEADILWMEQPGHFISYGSDEVEETSVVYLTWVKDSVFYTLMDIRGTEQPEIMFEMAEELIREK